MSGSRRTCWLALALLIQVTIQPACGQAAPADPDLDAADALIGRALFLRGFYSANDLTYDDAGHIEGTPKTADWTLAGFDLAKAHRQGPKGILLEGVRVAVRYNPDNHQFERHPQKTETVKILLAEPADPQRFAAALEAVFAQGIDPRLQQSTPDFWQHYFNPALTYPQDSLTGQQVAGLPPAPPAGSPPIVPPEPIHKVDARITAEAERDRVQGTVQMRLIVDSQGTPRRIAVARPLGYGLDAQAVESVSKWRFTPAMRDGHPVAAALTVNYDFQQVAPPHR